MIYKIADLLVAVPEAGDLVSRCRDYRCKAIEEKLDADICVRTEPTEDEKQFYWDLSENDSIYVISGEDFLFKLLRFSGLMLHASAVEVDGRAYLFSAPSGTGKSTHTKLWQEMFGEKARVFNDDKPALRYLDGKWYAYGTPWCGKDGININMRAPIGGICFLQQADKNEIRRLGMKEASQKIIWQTLRKFKLVENLDLMLSHVDSLVRNIPVFELKNRPEPEAARLSYETMRRAAEEIGL